MHRTSSTSCKVFELSTIYSTLTLLQHECITPIMCISFAINCRHLFSVWLPLMYGVIWALYP